MAIFGSAVQEKKKKHEKIDIKWKVFPEHTYYYIKIMPVPEKIFSLRKL